MREQTLLPTVRSYLKLYTSIPLKKLAGFCKMDEGKCRARLSLTLPSPTPRSTLPSTPQSSNL